jgi:hypothetical protein
MGCLLERKAQIIFVTASSVEEDGKNRKVVVESRPTFAIVRLDGSRERFSIAWEAIYDIARRYHAESLQRESRAEKDHKQSRRKRINPKSTPITRGILD